jgi:hypothetical protein
MIELDGFEILEASRPLLVEPKSSGEPLVGPFSTKVSGDGWLILNANGETILWAIDSKAAHFVRDLLHLAWKHRSRSLGDR